MQTNRLTQGTGSSSQARCAHKQVPPRNRFLESGSVCSSSSRNPPKVPQGTLPQGSSRHPSARVPSKLPKNCFWRSLFGKLCKPSKLCKLGKECKLRKLRGSFKASRKIAFGFGKCHIYFGRSLHSGHFQWVFYAIEGQVHN